MDLTPIKALSEIQLEAMTVDFRDEFDMKSSKD